MKKMLMVCALAAGAFATAQVAHADSFTFTFSGSTGSGHNQQTISGTVTFDAPAGGGAITNPDGSITFTSGETTPPPNNFKTGTFNVSGLSAFGPDTFNFADNTLHDNGGTYGFDSHGLGLNLQGTSTDVNFNESQAADGSIGFFIVFFNNVDTTWNIQESIVDNSVTPPAAAPEPGSLALLGTSILGGAGILRRRFRA